MFAESLVLPCGALLQPVRSAVRQIAMRSFSIDLDSTILTDRCFAIFRHLSYLYSISLLSMSPRTYSKKSQEKVHKVMREFKRGKLHSGRSGKRVRSRKQAVAIGLRQARREGMKVPAAK